MDEIIWNIEHFYHILRSSYTFFLISCFQSPRHCFTYGSDQYYMLPEGSCVKGVVPGSEVLLAGDGVHWRELWNHSPPSFLSLLCFLATRWVNLLSMHIPKMYYVPRMGPADHGLEAPTLWVKISLFSFEADYLRHVTASRLPWWLRSLCDCRSGSRQDGSRFLASYARSWNKGWHIC